MTDRELVLAPQRWSPELARRGFVSAAPALLALVPGIVLAFRSRELASLLVLIVVTATITTVVAVTHLRLVTLRTRIVVTPDHVRSELNGGELVRVDRTAPGFRALRYDLRLGRGASSGPAVLLTDGVHAIRLEGRRWEDRLPELGRFLSSTDPFAQPDESSWWDRLLNREEDLAPLPGLETTTWAEARRAYPAAFPAWQRRPGVTVAVGLVVAVAVVIAAEALIGTLR